MCLSFAHIITTACRMLSFVSKVSKKGSDLPQFLSLCLHRHMFHTALQLQGVGVVWFWAAHAVLTGQECEMEHWHWFLRKHGTVIFSWKESTVKVLWWSPFERWLLRNVGGGKWKGVARGQGDLWVYLGYQLVESFVKNKLWTTLGSSNMVERIDIIKHFCMWRKHLCCPPDLAFVLNTEGNSASTDDRAFQTPVAVCTLHHTLISDNSYRKSCRYGTRVMRSHSLMGSIVLI